MHREIGLIVLGVCGFALGAHAIETHLPLRAGMAASPAAILTVTDEAAYAELPSVPPSAPVQNPLELPILVYHIVRPSYPSDSAEVRALAVTPEVFDAELAHLKSAGYSVISFADLEAYFTRGTALPHKPIIISFDDGWSDQYEYAFPILKRYGYPATFFVFTNAIGTKGFLTWDELREMAREGMHIESHSKSHPYLTRLAATSSLEAEIAGSKQLLEEELGTPVTEFAYPFGMQNSRIEALVEAAGYTSARGDYFSVVQPRDRRYDLGGNNAPTTLAAFEAAYP